MPLPSAVVIEARVFAEAYLGFSPGLRPSRRLLDALPTLPLSTIVAATLLYDILDEIVEDGAWSIPLEPIAASMLYDSVSSFVDRMSTYDGVQFAPYESVLKSAFRMAVSSNIALSTCVAAALGIQFEIPVVVASELRKGELLQAFDWITQLRVPSLEEVADQL